MRVINKKELLNAVDIWNKFGKLENSKVVVIKTNEKIAKSVIELMLKAAGERFNDRYNLS